MFLVNKDSGHTDEMQASAKQLNNVDRHYGSNVVNTCLNHNQSQLIESQINTTHYSSIDRRFGSTHCSSKGCTLVPLTEIT